MTSVKISISDNIVNHPTLGDILLDIQGDLEIDVPVNTEDAMSEKDPQQEVVQFGRLEVEEDGKNCVLYVGTKQRLKGKVVKLEPPLALMKFSENDQNPQHGVKTKQVEIVRVIKQKLVFKDRPLPIL